jgi:hypothetical protein
MYRVRVPRPRSATERRLQRIEHYIIRKYYSYHTLTTVVVFLPHTIIVDYIHRYPSFVPTWFSTLNRLSTGSNSLAAGSLQATADLALGLETAVGLNAKFKSSRQRLSLLLQVGSAGLDSIDETESNGLGDVRDRAGDTQYEWYQGEGD